MAQRLIWSVAAADDLQSIAEYIARDSPRYATAVVDKILDLTPAESVAVYRQQVAEAESLTADSKLGPD